MAVLVLTAGAQVPAQSAEPVSPIIGVTAGASNIQTFAVTIPNDLDGLGADGAEIEAAFTVLHDDVVIGSVEAEPVVVGEVATSTMQLDLAGEYEVHAVLDDGTMAVTTLPTEFTVEADLGFDEPEIAPGDSIENFLPAPAGFDLVDSFGTDVEVPLLDGYSLGETLEDGAGIEVLDPEGEYVGVVYSVAVLEDGTQTPVVYETGQQQSSGQGVSNSAVVRASLRCGFVGDPCEELLDTLFDAGTTQAAIVSTWLVAGTVESSRLVGSAKRAVDSFVTTLRDHPIHLPLDLGLLPDALSMADAPRFRQGVGPIDQILTPSNYDYDPADADFRLHDYCSYVESWSYDTQFFGPCARHDKCIEDYVQGRTGGAAIEARYKCDRDFGEDLNQNCVVQNPPLDRSRTLLYAWCTSTANAMWAAVTAKDMMSP